MHIFYSLTQCILDFFHNGLEFLLFLFGLFLVHTQLFITTSTVYRLKVIVLVLAQTGNNKVVNVVGHNQHFKALLLVGLQQGRRTKCLFVSTSNVVNSLLVRFHSLHIVGKAGPVDVSVFFVGAFWCGGLKANNFCNVVLVGKVGEQAFFHGAIELGHKLVPFFQLLSLLFFQLVNSTNFTGSFASLFCGLTHFLEFAQELFHRLGLN